MAVMQKPVPLRLRSRTVWSPQDRNCVVRAQNLVSGAPPAADAFSGEGRPAAASRDTADVPRGQNGPVAARRPPADRVFTSGSDQPRRSSLEITSQIVGDRFPANSLAEKAAAPLTNSGAGERPDDGTPAHRGVGVRSRPPTGRRPFELECSGWHASRWTKDVTAPETAALVQAFVDATLTAQKGLQSPGPATGAG